MSDPFEDKRQTLIAALRHAGIHDERVLDAMGSLPREDFIASSLHTSAYDDRALGIDCGQTISQPFMVAMMTQSLHLHGSERVLEIGTGSGYQTAILARLARHVYTVERYPHLAEQATERLRNLGITNVSSSIGDGSLGWPAEAPFDRILVTAASPVVPERLILQLVENGILVVPVGVIEHQELLSIRRKYGKAEIHNLGGCLFVPLIGAEGWPEQV